MSVTEKKTYNLIGEIARDLGFADFGCAHAAPVPSNVQRYYMDSLNGGYLSGLNYLHRNIEKRFNPQLLVPGARCVLVFLAPYSLPLNMPAPDGIAQYALGKDYHSVIKGKLFAIMEMLKGMFPEFEGRAFTDSAPVLEREWGVRAGLGWIGKNNFLISKRYGIKNLIGVIICNLQLPATSNFEPDKLKQNVGSCGECRKCLERCPTGALGREFSTDTRKCISYHTIENRNLKAEMTAGNVPNFTGHLFGCDCCLDACPWNSRNIPGWSEFHTNYNILKEKGEQWWENVRKDEFETIFKDSPIMRGGLENIRASLKWGEKNKRDERF